MASFKTENREYVVRLDAPKIRDVRSECNLDLGALDFGSVASRLASDPVLLVDVLWVLCREQGGLVGITSKQFGESLTGDSLDDASRALIAARADFSPARMRSLILQQQETSERIRAKTMTMAAERLSDPAIEARLMAAAEKKLLREMEEALTRYESVTNSEESAESIQTG